MKPHIYKHSEMAVWYCSDGCWLGWGLTWRDALAAWRQRDRNYSCVHQRETALQRRRRS